MPDIIELSGPDCSGKTTQAKLLTFLSSGVQGFEGFGHYTSTIPLDLTPQEQWRWWYVDTSLESFSLAVLDGYSRRKRAMQQADSTYAIAERGVTGIKAQIAANFATRQDGTVEQYVDQVDDIVTTFLDDAGVAQDENSQEVVLLPDSEWAQANGSYTAVTRHINDDPHMSEAQNTFYAQYQQNFRHALTAPWPHSSAVTMIPVDRSAVQVQNVLRDHVGDPQALPRLLQHDPLVVGFGGLSESGKGTLAQYLVDHEGFTRLKLGYFNEVNRQGGQLYAEPSKVALSALHFLCHNRHLQRVTFESFHGPELAAHLKILLGNRFQGVYIDTPDMIRQERARDEVTDREIDPIQGQNQKDRQKIGAGVLQLRDIADILVDNSGIPEVAQQQLREGLNI